MKEIYILQVPQNPMVHHQSLTVPARLGSMACWKIPMSSMRSIRFSHGVFPQDQHYIYIYTYIDIQIQIQTYIHIYIDIQIYRYRYKHTYIYIQIYRYIDMARLWGFPSHVKSLQISTTKNIWPCRSQSSSPPDRPTPVKM